MTAIPSHNKARARALLALVRDTTRSNAVRKAAAGEFQELMAAMGIEVGRKAASKTPAPPPAVVPAVGPAAAPVDAAPTQGTPPPRVDVPAAPLTAFERHQQRLDELRAREVWLRAALAELDTLVWIKEDKKAEALRWEIRSRGFRIPGDPAPEQTDHLPGFPPIDEKAMALQAKRWRAAPKAVLSWDEWRDCF